MIDENRIFTWIFDLLTDTVTLAGTNTNEVYAWNSSTLQPLYKVNIKSEGMKTNLSLMHLSDFAIYSGHTDGSFRIWHFDANEPNQLAEEWSYTADGKN